MSYPPQLKLFHDHLLESQYWPREKIVAEQRTYLRQLLLHARDHVPFYRDGRLDAVFRGDEIDWSRWNDIPILTRAEALEHNHALESTNLPAHHGDAIVAFTSGSTGPALRVVRSQLASLYVQATRFRGHSWHRMDTARNMVLWFGENAEECRPPHGADVGAWGAPWSPRATGRRIQLNRFSSAEDLLHLIAESKAGYLSARPSAAHAAALEALRLGIDVKLDGIFTFYTGVREDERADCARAFGGARMIVPYSAKEGLFMAHQCPSGTHYHVNEETTLLEIVDENGRPCAEGEVGRVVVTVLYNYAQPLIRYEIGDLASFGAACACGRTLRVVERIAGRVVHMFRLPDGKRISLSISPDVCEAFGANYWQFAQVEPMLIEVRYVADGETGDTRPVIDLVKSKTHPDMQIRFSRRAELYRPHGRKFIEYVYEIAD